MHHLVIQERELSVQSKSIETSVLLRALDRHEDATSNDVRNARQRYREPRVVSGTTSAHEPCTRLLV